MTEPGLADGSYMLTLRTTEISRIFRQFGAEDYMMNSNPSEVFDDIKIPTLILNAKDDPVCHIDNVYEHQHRIEAMDYVILVLTDRGSHCAYFEGLTIYLRSLSLLGD